MNFPLKFLAALLLIAPFTMASSASDSSLKDEGEDLYHTIQKVNNNFYQAQIPNKKLWLVMERVDNTTGPRWQQYIKVQHNPRATLPGQKSMDTANRSEGTTHFKNVLEDVSWSTNEMWIAYITQATTPQPIPQNISQYKTESILKGLCPFANGIEMFVTVTSSPRAIITSHMGITISAEAARRRNLPQMPEDKQSKGTSMDLHSFAAKVMLRRNPNRKFMVNAPVFAMEEIILNALPRNTVYVGTREMQHIMKERNNTTFEDFQTRPEGPDLEEVMETAKDQVELLNSHHSDSDLLGNDALKAKTDDLVERNEMGIFIPSFKKINEQFPEKVKAAYNLYINPYYFDRADKEGIERSDPKYSKKFLDFMERYPPILSIVEDKDSIFAAEKNRLRKFTIFDPAKPTETWLMVNASIDDNQYENYLWMFSTPFRASGNTHYIAVDLKALADCRSVQ